MRRPTSRSKASPPGDLGSPSAPYRRGIWGRSESDLRREPAEFLVGRRRRVADPMNSPTPEDAATTDQRGVAVCALSSRYLGTFRVRPASPRGSSSWVVVVSSAIHTRATTSRGRDAPPRTARCRRRGRRGGREFDIVARVGDDRNRRVCHEEYPRTRSPVEVLLRKFEGKPRAAGEKRDHTRARRRADLSIPRLRGRRAARVE